MSLKFHIYQILLIANAIYLLFNCFCTNYGKNTENDCLRVLGLSFLFNKVLICAVFQTAEN